MTVVSSRAAHSTPPRFARSRSGQAPTARDPTRSCEGDPSRSSALGMTSTSLYDENIELFERLSRECKRQINSRLPAAGDFADVVAGAALATDRVQRKVGLAGNFRESAVPKRKLRRRRERMRGDHDDVAAVQGQRPSHVDDRPAGLGRVILKSPM